MVTKTIVVTVKTDVGQTMDFDLLRAAAVRICRKWNVQRMTIERSFVEFHIDVEVTIGAPDSTDEREMTTGVVAAFAEADASRSHDADPVVGVRH